MALNIKNQDVENLLDEVVSMIGESKTEAVRRALLKCRERPTLREFHKKDEQYYLTFMQDEIWSQIPVELLGTTLAKEEEESILGYGE